MKNFIKECKNDFDFSAVSSKIMLVNDNRLHIHGLVYNIFNAMRRLAFTRSLLKACMETFRMKLLKIASRVVRHGRKIIYRLCSSCPCQNEYRQIIDNIHKQGMLFFCVFQMCICYLIFGPSGMRTFSWTYTISPKLLRY